MIGSFFDIFTEVSLDGGQTWGAATNGPVHVELRSDPAGVPSVTEPNNYLPPRNDAYVSPAAWHAAYAAGYIIKDVKHSFFTQSQGTVSRLAGNSRDITACSDAAA